MFYLVKVGFIVLFLVVGIFVANSNNQTINIPQSYAQCTAPSQVQNVQVSYPACVGTQCDLNSLSCSWGAVTGATAYQVTITQVETGTVVYNQQVASSTTSVTQSITQNKTYQCQVAAVNACGTGPAGSQSLLCAINALVSPTVAPTSTPIPAPIPTVQPTGSYESTILAVVAVIGLMVAGGLLLL